MSEQAVGDRAFRVEFTLLARDYFWPCYLMVRRAPWMIILHVLAFLLIVAVSVTVMRGDPSGFFENVGLTISGIWHAPQRDIFLPIMAGVVLWDVFVAVIIVLSIRMQPIRGKTYHVVVGDEGIRMSAEDIASDVKWSSLKQVVFTGSGIGLQFWTRNYIVIPRRALPTDADFEALRIFVSGHLPATTRVKGRRPSASLSD